MTRKLLCLICTFFVFFASAQLPTDSIIALDAIVINAEKINNRLKESSKAVDIISQEIINENRSLSLYEIIDKFSAVNINGIESAYGEFKFASINGMKAKYLVILLDGIPLVDASSQGARYDLNLIDKTQIKKIEILKGGQGVLYGIDAVGGVINIVTNNKHSSPLDLYANVTTGSLPFEQFSLNTKIGFLKKYSIAIRSLPFEQFSLNTKIGFLKKYSIAIKGNSLWTSGISAARPMSQTVSDANFTDDPFKQENIGLGVTYKSLRLNYFINHEFSNTRGHYDADAFMDSKFNHYRNQAHIFSFKADYLVGNDHKLKFLLSFQDIKRKFNDASFGISNYFGEHLFGEFRWLHSPTKNLKSTFGIDYRYNNGKSTFFVNTKKLYAISPYLLINYNKIKNIALDLGVRFNRHKIYHDAWIYSLSLSYLLFKHFKFYIGSNTTYKAPDIAELYGGFGGNENLRVEQGNEFYLGFSLLPNLWKNFNVDTSLSISEINDKIVSGVVNEKVSLLNIEKSHFVNLSFKLGFENQKFKSSLQFQYINIDNRDENNRPQVAYRSPKFVLKLYGIYHLSEKLSVAWFGKWMDKRTDRFFDPITFVPQDVSLKAYFLQDLSFNYHFLKKNLSLYLRLHNFTSQNIVEVYGFSTLGFRTKIGLTFNLNVKKHK